MEKYSTSQFSGCFLCLDDANCEAESGSIEAKLCKSIDCLDWVLPLSWMTSWHHIHKNHTFNVPKESDHDLPGWRRSNFNLRYNCRLCHHIECSFVSCSRLGAYLSTYINLSIFASKCFTDSEKMFSFEIMYLEEVKNHILCKPLKSFFLITSIRLPCWLKSVRRFVVFHNTNNDMVQHVWAGTCGRTFRAVDCSFKL